MTFVLKATFEQTYMFYPGANFATLKIRLAITVMLWNIKYNQKMIRSDDICPQMR